MRKITYPDFENEGHDYFLCEDKIQKVTDLEGNKKDLDVVCFWLEKNLTNEEKKQWLNKYSNIRFTSGYYRWEPSQNIDIVVCYEKTRKALKLGKN